MIDRWEAYFSLAPEQGAQWGLLCLMTGISEGAWAAGWIDCLEFTLWDRVCGKENGTRLVTERQVALLKLLSEEADGWWAWDDEENGPRFLGMQEWRAIVSR